MRLKFQNWIEENHFPDNAKNLLNSSVDCYKSQTYTASLLMGYLGFLVVLKERVMSATKPGVFPEGLWNDLILRLRNEDKWEESIFDAVLQREKTTGQPPVRSQDPVFVINDNLRTQIRYWKDRRNDCVHNKDSIITISHVENFWSFLESNLQKVTIEGGKVTLLNKFARHYDRSYTPANEDVTPLIKEIKSAVTKIEMADFWKELFDTVSDFFDYTLEIRLINKILNLNDQEISVSLISYMKANNNLLKSYISEYPSIIGQLGYSKSDIRNFWQKKMGNMSNVLSVYASMLRNNLIPADEIKEANEKFTYKCNYPEKAEDHQTLLANGFGEALYEYLFVVHTPSDRKYWLFMNDNERLYTAYVKLYGLKDNTVKVLCEELGKSQWTSFFLQGALDRLFQADPTKMNEFKDKALALGLELPAAITALHA